MGDNKEVVNNDNSMANSKTKPSARRKFLTQFIQTTGIATFAGLVWAGYADEIKHSPLTLRPPGALEGDDFLAACTKCGLCVQACKQKVGEERFPLLLAKPGDRKPLGIPYFIPKDRPCLMCTDAPCVEACPTNALDEQLLSDKSWNLDINQARMGLAVLDTETCIAFWGNQCSVCYRACPLMDKAITLEYSRNKRTGKHAFLVPLVHSKYCTGCGLCERSCITKKASIFVLPHKLAQGEAATTYIKGWDESDEKRLEEAPEDVTTRTKRSSKSAIDTLNEGIDTDD